MNEDKILQMFFDIGQWTKAIEKGVLKDIRKDQLIRLTDEHTRMAMAYAMRRGKYEISPPHTAQIPKDNGEQSSTYLHVVDRDPVELVITNASLRKDGKIFIMGYSYYTGEEYEQECDVESGMDILNFILSQKSFECYE